MSAEIEDRESSDIRRVIEAAACNWSMSGHSQSLCLRVPAGPMRAYVNAAQLQELVRTLLDRACGSARRFGTLCIIVERIVDHAVINVGAKSGQAFVVTLPLKSCETTAISRRCIVEVLQVPTETAYKELVQSEAMSN
jgi:hypothetical protein